MSTCKFCGKSGLFHQVTRNGMCPHCERFVLLDLKNRSRIFNESKEIFNKSENPDVIVSRINIAKETLTHVIQYERKGIGTFTPLPSKLLKDVEEEQDNIIYDGYERAFASLKNKLMNMKTQSARNNNIYKFLEKIDSHLIEMKNPERLNSLKNNVAAFLPQIESQSLKTNNPPPLQVSTPPPLPQKDAILIKEIHPATLLILTDKAPENIGSLGGIRISISYSGENKFEIIGPDEPSTIYKKLPVSKPRDTNSVEKPPYYPSYAQLSPEQRWIYLKWVEDISQPVNIGYVFIYYYGLERNLVIGDFETAYNEVVFLRHSHQNKSFESYSYNALLFASALKNRTDLLQTILTTESQNGIVNEDLMFKYRFGIGINPEEFMSLAKKFKGTNLRYIKAVPDRYKAAITKVIVERYNQQEYPLVELFDIHEIPQISTIAFSNVSFPSSLRTPKMPDFIRYSPFAKDCQKIFEESHMLVKEDLIRERLINE